MKKSMAVIANTLVDKRGDRLTVSALESIVEQLQSYYVPVNIEHDPRIPIQGRISGGFLREIETHRGEFEVVANIEFFDGHGYVTSVDNGKEYRLEDIPESGISVRFDRNFNNDVDLKAIDRICEEIKSERSLAIKNSVDPIAVLEIVALVSFGTIAKGFLSKIGGDSWEKVRDEIKKLFGRKKEGEKEKILSLSLRVEKEDISFDVDVLATNPKPEEIDALFEEGLKELDLIVPALYRDEAKLKKMVFEYRKGSMQIKYAINKDCIPLQANIKIPDSTP